MIFALKLDDIDNNYLIFIIIVENKIKLLNFSF